MDCQLLVYRRLSYRRSWACRLRTYLHQAIAPADQLHRLGLVRCCPTRFDQSSPHHLPTDSEAHLTRPLLQDPMGTMRSYLMSRLSVHRLCSAALRVLRCLCSYQGLYQLTVPTHQTSKVTTHFDPIPTHCPSHLNPKQRH